MKRSIIFLSRIIFVFALCFSTVVFSQEMGEQGIINKIPTKVPLKIEIINGEMGSTPVNLKIKVTNVGKMSIYYFSLSLGSEEEFAPRNKVGLTSLQFGNVRLSDFSDPFKTLEAERALTNPLEPAESTTFEIDNKLIASFWNRMVEKGLTRTSKIALEFSLLRFSDGSGYMGSSATDLPDPQRSSTNSLKPTNRGFFLSKVNLRQKGAAKI